jgi:hypothetical protein
LRRRAPSVDRPTRPTDLSGVRPRGSVTRARGGCVCVWQVSATDDRRRSATRCDSGFPRQAPRRPALAGRNRRR